ncbi:MAG TPA: CAP domain-containing protein [Dokdonella sp.]
MRIGGLSAVASLLLFAAPAHAAFMDCVLLDGFDGESSDAPAEWKGNLRVHNCARGTVLPVATPRIPPLRWSPSLAQRAQGWANQCTWQHSGTPGLGENLYAAAPWSAAQTTAATSWASEFADYNYAANSCASGEQCGHYTQMVWRSTRFVGCAIRNCSTGTPFGSQFPNWTIVVCNYSPPGNYIGQRPY